MGLWLSAGVHAVIIDQDAVFLDVDSNAYFCLPGIGEVLGLEGRVLHASSDALAEDLVSAGLAASTPDLAPTLATQPPLRTARAVLEDLAPAKRRKPRMAHWRRAIAAGLASRLAEQRSFATRLPAAPRQRAPAASPGLLADLDAFRRLQPWLPFDGACLFRSQLLRHYLVGLGHQVDWIFAVRTWPFAAHCWLQAGDLALDDEAERLVAYHPIMVR
ncbi:lasso peptide biosynthesis B2 protein [Caulobacter sp.]|uniref:lasso peptide biosynthesis B2 protein n=1 Tax=Caulobacter sp. TaxID=78 RepID=UPI0031E2DA1E